MSGVFTAHLTRLKAALEGAGRYLRIAEDRFGREDLAVVSYHMGIGNLETVLEAYGSDDASWAQVYFDATPHDHPRAYRLLSCFGDDSATYLWRVYAARSTTRQPAIASRMRCFSSSVPWSVEPFRRKRMFAQASLASWRRETIPAR